MPALFFPLGLHNPGRLSQCPGGCLPTPAVYKHPKPAQACAGGPWVQDRLRTHNKVGENTRLAPPTTRNQAQGHQRAVRDI